MSERVAKLEREAARARGELVHPVRARITRGEVEGMLKEHMGQVEQALNDYHERRAMPVLRFAIQKAAAYLPWWRRLANWFWVKWYARKGA